MTQESARLRSVRDDFMRRGGYWPPRLDVLIETAPDFVEDYLRFAGIPLLHRRLDDRTRSLIHLAVDASVTHLNADAVRCDIRTALRAGVPAAEIVEVIKLVSVLGIHTCTLGVPALLEEWAEFAAAQPNSHAGPQARPVEPDGAALALKERFIAGRGYWNPIWDGILVLDPEFFDAFIGFSSNPWRTGSLSPKIRELIYIAIDTSTTHLFELGTHIHIKQALQYGATREEIMEVLQLVSLLGIQSCALALPILQEELAALAE